MPSITEAIGDVVKTLVSVACEFSARYPADTEDVDIYSFRFRRHSSGSCGDATLRRRYKPPVEGCCNCQINDLSVYSLKRRGSGCKVGRCGTRFFGHNLCISYQSLLLCRLLFYAESALYELSPIII